MTTNMLTIPLDRKFDQYDAAYYVGKLATTGTLNFKKGTVLFVLISDEGNEELRIGKADPGKRCGAVRRSVKEDDTRYYIDLVKRESETEGEYYMAVVQDDVIELDLDSGDGWAFLIFTSKPGYEQLQIARATSKIGQRRKSGEMEAQTSEPAIERTYRRADAFRQRVY